MGNGTLTGTDMFVAVAAAIQANERQLPERQTDPAGPKCEAQILVARDSDPIPDSQEFDRVAMRDISPTDVSFCHKWQAVGATLLIQLPVSTAALLRAKVVRCDRDSTSEHGYVIHCRFINRLH